MFDAVDTLTLCLQLTAAMLPKLTVNEARMFEAAGRAYSNATDLADYLAKKGLPFREAHETVGRLVALGVREGKDLQELSLAQMRAVSDQIDGDVYGVLELKNVVNVRNSYGGTALAQVEMQIDAAKAQLVIEHPIGEHPAGERDYV